MDYKKETISFMNRLWLYSYGYYSVIKKIDEKLRKENFDDYVTFFDVADKFLFPDSEGSYFFSLVIQLELIYNRFFN